MGSVFPDYGGDPPDDNSEEEDDPEAHHEEEGDLEEDPSTQDQHNDQEDRYDTKDYNKDQNWTEDEEDEEEGSNCIEFSDKDYKTYTKKIQKDQNKEAEYIPVIVFMKKVKTTEKMPERRKTTYEYMSSKEEMSHKLEEMNKAEEHCEKLLECRQDKEAQNADFKRDHKDLSEAEGPTVDTERDWTPGLKPPKQKHEDQGSYYSDCGHCVDEERCVERCEEKERNANVPHAQWLSCLTDPWTDTEDDKEEGERENPYTTNERIDVENPFEALKMGGLSYRSPERVKYNSPRQWGAKPITPLNIAKKGKERQPRGQAKKKESRVEEETKAEERRFGKRLMSSVQTGIRGYSIRPATVFMVITKKGPVEAGEQLKKALEGAELEHVAEIENIQMLKIKEPAKKEHGTVGPERSERRKRSEERADDKARN